jgi:hypothetical protein
MTVLSDSPGPVEYYVTTSTDNGTFAFTVYNLGVISNNHFNVTIYGYPTVEFWKDNFNVGGVDTELTGGSWNSTGNFVGALGVNPADIVVHAGSLIDPNFGYATEEHVKGHVLENININVYTQDDQTSPLVVTGVIPVEAFQTTVVNSLSTPPSAPVIIAIDPSNINNLLIVSPPKEIKQEDLRTSTVINPLDINALDKDLLKYDELNKDYLIYDILAMNYLDVDLLPNMLDESTRALSASQESMLEQSTMLPGYSEASGLKYAVTEDGKLVLMKVAAHTAIVTVNKEANLVLNITQDGSPLYQKVNTGGTTNITIIQK